MSCFFCVIYAVLKVKLSAEYKIREGKIGMVKEIMEGIDEMQVLCELLIQPLIPIIRFTVHADELFERNLQVLRKV